MSDKRSNIEKEIERDPRPSSPAASKAYQKRTEEAGKGASDDFFQLRKHWSWAIIAWISILILFSVVLTFLVGFKQSYFKDYPWFITTVTVESFLQIVGLGYVAVRFLFSEHKVDW